LSRSEGDTTVKELKRTVGLMLLLLAGIIALNYALTGHVLPPVDNENVPYMVATL
jgi:hypothetical protein